MKNKLSLKDNTMNTVLLCLYVADPATFPTFQLVFSEKINISESVYYYFINIVDIKFLTYSPKLHHALLN